MGSATCRDDGESVLPFQDTAVEGTNNGSTMRTFFFRVILAGVIMDCALAGCAHSHVASYCPNVQQYARSWLALNDEERALLDKNGFVIADDGDHFGDTFLGGWLTIFRADLPLYVTADALLHAIHRSYDAILKDVELSILVPATGQMLASIRERLGRREGAALSPQARRDVDLFAAVALSLLQGAAVHPVAGADTQEIAAWLAKASDAKGFGEASVFGRARLVDFSQFTPRGHYSDEGDTRLPVTERGVLARYFRAMMWLGRTDVRMIETGPADAPVLRRRELELACALHEMLATDGQKAWRELEATMNTFVGERDSMGPGDVDQLYRDLGIGGFQDLAAVPAERLLTTMARGRYGYPRIETQPALATDPAAVHFSMTGQRYIVDLQAFSDVVYDRVAGRMMPDPLDVAYSVLGNGEAKTLLSDEIAKYRYESNLEDVRSRVESLGAPFWSSSLYNLWLGALRALGSESGDALPPVVRTPAWSRRMLNTQLASWADLRHDSIVYAKQSYTDSQIICSFPDAYVDPYPLFYERLEAFARQGQELVRTLDFGRNIALRDRIGGFFRGLGDVTANLARIAHREEKGDGLSAADLAFINHALSQDPPMSGGCGGPPTILRGWYVDLFYAHDADSFKPTIADVHTQPTDANGSVVGKVLHVGTGEPRLIVVNVAHLGPPRLYTGVVSSYFEVTTDRFNRLTDDRWRALVELRRTAVGLSPHVEGPQPPDDVRWMRDLVGSDGSPP
jgi:hypothetical protein